MANEHEHCVAQEFEDTPVRTFEKLRYHVFVCSDAGDFCGCEAHDSGALVAALRQELGKRGLLAAVKVTLMQCRQPGAQGPVVAVHPDGIWYDGVTVAHAAAFVDQQIVRGEPIAALLLHGGPKPVTAVPAHVANAGECCASTATPEQRAAELRS
jgi:(2Fe-2S) ferredoxin